MEPSSKIKTYRQNGELDKALVLAQAYMQADAENIWNKRNISWVYQTYLKKFADEGNFSAFMEHLNSLIDLQMPEEENVLFENVVWQIVKIGNKLIKKKEVGAIKQLFESVKKLSVARPSDEYSALLKLFQKAFKNDAVLLDLIHWWGLEHLQEEDFRPFRMDNGKSIMALSEQVYIAYSKELLQQWNAHKGTELKLEIDQVAKKMEQLEEKYPDLLYIPYYRVQLSVAIGDSEDSFADLIPFVKKKQRDFWAWDILGDVCNDNDQKFACYCKGLSCSAPKEMTIGLKQTIIPLLIERQHYDVAKTEVEAILSIRQENGWKVPHQLLDYQSQPWYANAKVTNVKKLYQNYIEQAELLLYADVNEEPIVITHVNNEKAMLSFIYKNTPCYSNYDKRSLKPKIGDIFMARVVNIDPKGYCNYATLRLDNDNTLRSQYVKRIEGEFVIAHSGQFGFIGKDYFVNNETIVKNRLQNHKHYTATAIKNYDSKKQRWGWSVIKILDA